MKNTLTSPTPELPSRGLLVITVFTFFLVVIGYVFYEITPPIQRDRLQMEKSSGKNGKHSNPKARQSAEDQYQKAKDAWQQIKSKPNKTSQDKQLMQQLEKQVKRLEKKKNWKGENHSQKHKGN